MRYFDSKKSSTFLLLILFFCFEHSYAQKHNLYVEKIGLEDGLSSYNILEITQDQRGYLWIATDYGLNRYDGQKIKSYTKEENGLFGNYITAVYFDAKGNAWLSAKDHNDRPVPCVFDPISEETHSISAYLGIELPFDLKKASIYLSPYKNGFIFSVSNEGQKELFEYDGSTLSPILVSFDIATYPDYIFHGNAHRISEKKYALILYPKNRENKTTSCAKVLVVDVHGNKLDIQDVPSGFVDADFKIANYESPYSIYYQQKFTTSGDLQIVPINNQKQRFTIPHIKNHALVSSEFKNDKLFLLDADSLTIYNKKGKILQQAKHPINLTLSHNMYFLDEGENYWVSNDKSLYKLRFDACFFEQEFAYQTPPYKARGIHKGKSGQLYAGTIGAIHSQKNGTWKQKNKNLVIGTQKLFHNVLSIYEENHQLWLGLEEGILLRYQLPSWEATTYNPIKSPHRELPTMMWSMHRSKSGRLWIGTAHGLFYLDESQDKIVPLDTLSKQTFPNSNVWSFHHNEAGTWLCTSNGLYLMDLEAGKVLAHYSLEKEGDAYIPAINIVHLHEDAVGVFWLATKGSGLVRWNPKDRSFKQYTQKSAGLSHNTLYAVYGDELGYLWLPSNRGLMAFNKENEQVQIYLEEDGLSHNEFNTISHHQDGAGRLYFGGQNGFIHFHPKDVRISNQEMPFCITSCYTQKKESDVLINTTSQVLNEQTILLEPDDKMFELHFALLDYNDSKNHQYSYQIIGYEKKWNFLKKGELQLNNLPYGNYRLKLRAKASNSGVWQDYPKEIQILVLYPFYLQWWFIGFVFLSVGFSIYSIFRWRIHQLKQREKELESTVKKRTAQIEADKKIIEQQAEELKALDKVKSRFFANISHELRTPLTLILGPLSYILDNEAAWEKEAIQRQLLTMQRNGKSLMQLIEEILDLSKLEAHKLELLEEVTPVKQYFERLFTVFKGHIDNQKINGTLVFRLQNQNLKVLLDRKKIEKVVNNFMSNAIKFTPQNGTVCISITEQDNLLEIQVEDTGSGIHPNDLPYVFERFFQSKQADQKLYGGTGIGLALVNEFAALMNGRAYAQSTLGEGSRFYFEFPKKEVTMEEAVFSVKEAILKEEVAVESIGTDFTILVVEDNVDMLLFVSQLLQERYKEVLTAKNGAEGLEMLRKHGTKIQLIISDVMMPEIDGLTMLRAIKSNTEWNGIPTIMLTALAEERDKLHALTIGVDDYLTKPFSTTELIVRVQNLLFNYHQRIKWNSTQISEEEEDTLLQETPPSENLLAKNIKTGLSQNDIDWLENAKTIIKDSIETGVLSVEQLAKQLFISKRQLTRKFKSFNGLTPAKAIREIQLQQAREVLEKGLFISITEVAVRCGFDSLSTFHRLFKERFGKSPKDYSNHFTIPTNNTD